MSVRVRVERGDVTDIAADGLLTTTYLDDETLGDAHQAILAAGGADFFTALRRKRNRMQEGETFFVRSAVITGSFNFGGVLFFADLRHYMLSRVVIAMLMRADELRLRNVSLPLLRTDSRLGHNAEECADLLAMGIKLCLGEHEPRNLKNIAIATNDAPVTARLQRAINTI